jgi:hypothetical protein
MSVDSMLICNHSFARIRHTYNIIHYNYMHVALLNLVYVWNIN